MSKKPVKPSTAYLAVVFTTILVFLAVELMRGADLPTPFIVAAAGAIVVALLTFLVRRWPNSSGDSTPGH